MSGILILYSIKDIAGSNIADILKEKFRNNDEVSVLGNDNVLYMQKFDGTPEICIVASRHKSKSGKSALTCHSPGNFGSAEFGGNPKELGMAPANYIRECIMLLENNHASGYEITLEVTHHGPTALNFPIMFVEIGSTEKEWNDSAACLTVAEVIYKVTKSSQKKFPVAIGFGGGHYCRKFTNLTESYAIGHICPKYNLQNVDEEIVQQMIDKTIPRPEFALIDKKGVNEKKRLLDILESRDLEIRWV